VTLTFSEGCLHISDTCVIKAIFVLYLVAAKAHYSWGLTSVQMLAMYSFSVILACGSVNCFLGSSGQSWEYLTVSEGVFLNFPSKGRSHWRERICKSWLYCSL